MAYQIVSSDSQKLIFQRESEGCSVAVFISIGVVFLVAGAVVNLVMPEWIFPQALFKVLVPVFGVIAIVVGIFLPKQIRETSPEQLIFDHEKGAVKVLMTKDGAQTGIIRYDEIEGFDIFVERQSSGKSTSYYYNTYLKKKDGGEWFLSRSGSTSKAEEILNVLRAQVDLTKSFSGVAASKLSPKISKQEGAAKTVIHWQNKVSLGAPIFLIFFAVIFISIISFVFMNDDFDAAGIFPLIIIGFIFSVFLLVMIITVKKMIKDATTRYAVSVDDQHLEYYEFSKSSGQMRNTKKLPMVEVKQITYSFSQAKASMNNGLRILTAKDLAHLQTQRDNPLTSLKDLWSGKNQPITLSITALNPVECLQLESWLQELILKKGNVIVA